MYLSHFFGHTGKRYFISVRQQHSISGAWTRSKCLSDVFPRALKLPVTFSPIYHLKKLSPGNFWYLQSGVLFKPCVSLYCPCKSLRIQELFGQILTSAGHCVGETRVPWSITGSFRGAQTNDPSSNNTITSSAWTFTQACCFQLQPSNSTKIWLKKVI